MPKKNNRNTRGRIISAAWKLFYENGYEETTIEEIVYESHTSRGSFYHYFEGKDALLGTLAFLNDQDNRIYLRFGLIERIYLGLIQVAVFTLPAMVISIICFIVSRIGFSPLHVVVYTLLVTLVSFVLGTVMTLLPIRTARSKIFSSILPVYLILSFLFSGILMDLTNFGTALRTLSRLFPPSMF